MTTKFSQGARTQSLPPVCRSTTIIPITWAPPPYPQIRGFLKFRVMRPAMPYLERTYPVIAIWDLDANVCADRPSFPDWYGIIQVFPYDGSVPARVNATAWGPPSGSYGSTWFVDPYTPGDIWESGQLSDHNVADDEDIWITLSTYTP